MKTSSCRLVVVTLEDRSVPSTVAYGDFNNDGRMDMAAITAPTIVTVSLANPDGSNTVTAKLTAPKNQPMQDIYLRDADGDGNLDVTVNSYTNGGGYTHIWLGNGDGTFDSRTTEKWRSPFGHIGHGGTW